MKAFEKIKRTLRDKRGFSTFIELSVLCLVVLMMGVMCISYMQIYAKHNLVNSMAHEIARFVEIRGGVDGSTYTEFERLKRAAGYSDAAVSFSQTGRLQLEEPFTVTVTVQQKFGIGGIKVIPVTVKAIATGRSEKYWK